MTLYKKTICFAAQQHKNKPQRPHCLQEVLRAIKTIQIRKHETQRLVSPQRALVLTTRKILNENSHKERVQTPKRASTSMRNRIDDKLIQTRRQLELINQLNRSFRQSKINRYQQQILQEQAEVEATIFHHKIKRNWLTANSRSSKSRPKRDHNYSQRPNISHSQEVSQQKRIPSIENEGQILFDRLFPSRRFSLQRKPSKYKVSPWNVSQFS